MPLQMRCGICNVYATFTQPCRPPLQLDWKMKKLNGDGDVGPRCTTAQYPVPSENSSGRQRSLQEQLLCSCRWGPVKSEADLGPRNRLFCYVARPRYHLFTKDLRRCESLIYWLFCGALYPKLYPVSSQSTTDSPNSQRCPHRLPIIHLGAHGSKKGVQLSNEETIGWPELGQLLLAINRALDNGLLLPERWKPFPGRSRRPMCRRDTSPGGRCSTTPGFSDLTACTGWGRLGPH